MFSITAEEARMNIKERKYRRTPMWYVYLEIRSISKRRSGNLANLDENQITELESKGYTVSKPMLSSRWSHFIDW